jgi:hypothetical protein
MSSTSPIGFQVSPHNRTGTDPDYFLVLDEAVRRQHIWVPGQTGTGKSTLMYNWMAADMLCGRGFILLDPHGQTAELIANFTPKDRMKDVIYFDPRDPKKIVTFNPFHSVPPLYQHALALDITEAFKRKYADIWGPRMDGIMKSAIHLLLTIPGMTLVDLHRMLLDEAYREALLMRCPDKAIVSYWRNEFPKVISKREFGTAIQPITTKLGEFVYNPILRDIFAQEPTISIPYIINNRKILICNLSTVIGSDASDILGSLLLARIQQAAHEREVIPEEDRQDFTLYIEEAASFVSTTTKKVLSESRKYRLNLALFHQYLDQLPEGLPQAIVGNVGTTIAFRIGPYDSELLSRFLDVPEQHLLKTPNRYAYVRTIEDGKPSVTKLVAIAAPHHPRKALKRVQKRTRAFYARPRLGDEQWSMLSSSSFSPAGASTSDTGTRRIRSKSRPKLRRKASGYS